MGEQEKRAAEETTESRQGLRLIVGVGLGYLIGRAILDKPALGAVLGGAVALVIGSQGSDEG